MLRRGSKLGPLTGLASGWRHFLRACDGVTLIEFSLVAPMLGFLLLGGIEVGRYVLLNQKLSRVAISTSDLVSRARVASQGDIDQVFAAAGHSMRPFELGGDGVIHITSISTDGNPTPVPRMDWQLSGSGTATHASRIGTTVGQPATPPNGFTMDPDRNIIVVEVFFDYEPFLFAGVVDAKTIRQVAMHRPRLVALNELRP